MGPIMAAQEARKRSEPRDHLLHKRLLAIMCLKSWKREIYVGGPLMLAWVGQATPQCCSIVTRLYQNTSVQLQIVIGDL